MLIQQSVKGTAMVRGKLLTVTVVALIAMSCCASRVHAEAQDTGRWQEAMRAFDIEDNAAAPPANAIVFTGSSSIVFWKTLSDDMAPLRVVRRGFGGSTMSDVLYWLDRVVLKYRPRAVVVYAGDNDIGHYNASAEDVLRVFKAVVSRVHTELPEARIYFLAIKPSIQRWEAWPDMRRANDLVRALCETDTKLRFIDVASPMLDEQGQPRADLFEADKLHLNASGYRLWVSQIRPVLLEHEVASTQ
jgi:lysophospholipase L1-like esterase